MSKPALVRADAIFTGFDRPANLGSWTNTRVDRTGGAETLITEHSTPQGSGIESRTLSGAEGLLKSSKDLADWAMNAAPRLQKEIEERLRLEAEEKARKELAERPQRQESEAKKPAPKAPSDCLLDPECAPVGETPEERAQRIQRARSTAGAASNMDGKRGRATYASPTAGGESQTDSSQASRPEPAALSPQTGKRKPLTESTLGSNDIDESIACSKRCKAGYYACRKKISAKTESEHETCYKRHAACEAGCR
jgi:hypothetical protein